ncbi:MAG TPA: VIT domain-containing protein, partial [Thermoanaerobaculia bacterium]
MRGLAAAVLLLFVSFTAAAEEAPVTLDQIHHPALLIKTNQPGVFLTAPAVQTHIAMRVRGLVARAVVRQTFTNPSNRCVEAVYAFPLPDDATVDAMRLTVGARTIVGHIKERAEAARVYEEARSEGRKASLLEQHRPNLFTISLASLGAGESASIELEYQQLVTVDEHFSLRIPLAIGPRYMPGDAAPLPAVPHASGTRNPVTIEIDLDAGIPLDRVDSATHAIDTVPLTGSRMRIQPRDTELASDRDFELTWTPRLGAMPQSASFSETAGDQRYTLLMLFPPALAGGSTLPRETIYIIDTSGSMAGPSMEQAKLALLSAIRRL